MKQRHRNLKESRMRRGAKQSNELLLLALSVVVGAVAVTGMVLAAISIAETSSSADIERNSAVIRNGLQVDGPFVYEADNAQVGDLLMWNGSAWVTGNAPVESEGDPLPGDTLVWNGTDWVPRAIGTTLPVDGAVNQPGDILVWNGTDWRPRPEGETLPVDDTLNQPGNILVWNGTNWLPQPRGETLPGDDVADDGDVLVYNATTEQWETQQPTPELPPGSMTGDILQWDGTQWVATVPSVMGLNLETALMMDLPVRNVANGSALLGPAIPSGALVSFTIFSDPLDPTATTEISWEHNVVEIGPYEQHFLCFNTTDKITLSEPTVFFFIRNFTTPIPQFAPPDVILYNFDRYFETTNAPINLAGQPQGQNGQRWGIRITGGGEGGVQQQFFINTALDFQANSTLQVIKPFNLPLFGVSDPL